MSKVNTLTDDNKRFIIKHSKEMSLTELSLNLKIKEKFITNFCYRVSAPTFNENITNWKKYKYLFGSDGYAMYPFNGAYKQSSTVTNAMLEG